jgi:ribose-phosphate pyrophosphokinase
MDAGALSVRAYITHGVLSNGANKKIDASVLEELVISDSIPMENASKKIRQVTVAELFGEAMRRITNEESVSSLFK